jgi:hypothetical protein
MPRHLSGQEEGPRAPMASDEIRQWIETQQAIHALMSLNQQEQGQPEEQSLLQRIMQGAGGLLGRGAPQERPDRLQQGPQPMPRDVTALEPEISQEFLQEMFGEPEEPHSIRASPSPGQELMGFMGRHWEDLFSMIPLGGVKLPQVTKLALGGRIKPHSMIRGNARLGLEEAMKTGSIQELETFTYLTSRESDKIAQAVHKALNGLEQAFPDGRVPNQILDKINLYNQQAAGHAWLSVRGEVETLTRALAGDRQALEAVQRSRGVTLTGSGTSAQRRAVLQALLDDAIKFEAQLSDVLWKMEMGL